MLGCWDAGMLGCWDAGMNGDLLSTARHEKMKGAESYFCFRGLIFRYGILERRLSYSSFPLSLFFPSLTVGSSHLSIC